MRYRVKALQDGASITALLLDAADESDAARQAENRGYAVLAIKPQRSWRAWQWKRSASFPLALFSQELLTLLEAGLPLMEAMEALTEKEPRPEIKKLFRQIIASLYEGHSLSFALEQFPASFPPLYIATVRASEKTGDLAEALARYVAYHTQMDSVRKKIVSASLYPLLLIAAGGLVAAFLMVYVVPRFSRIYEDMGSALPLSSRLLLNWGQLLETHAVSMLAAVAALAAGMIYAATRPAVRQWLVQQMWRIPAIGERMKTYQLARFYRTLGMLLRGGTPVASALDMVAGLLQPILRDRLRLAALGIREGRAISVAMESHGLTTPVALRLLRVGERSGRMGEMMERIAAFHDDETARWVDWFTRLFEPLLMAAIGVAIGFIVVLMYFPIFELAGSIQ